MSPWTPNMVSVRWDEWAPAPKKKESKPAARPANEGRSRPPKRGKGHAAS